MIQKYQTTSDRIFGFDLLFTLAICMVLLAKCIWIFTSENNLISQFAALLNFTGVEIFLVISGFFIGEWIYSSFVHQNAKSIFQVRTFRIIYIYYLILIFNFLIAFFIGNSIEYNWKYFLFLQNLYSSMPDFYIESWVVCVVIFAGLIFASLLLVFNFLFKPKNKSAFFLSLSVGLILLFLMAKFIYNANTIHTTISQWDTSLKSVVVYRLDSVFLGFLAYWLFYNYHFFWKKWRMVFVIFGSVGIGFIFVGVGYFQLLIDNHKMFWNVFYLPITSFAIVLFLPILSELKMGFSAIKQSAAFISSISLIMYLLHCGVVLQFLNYFIETESLSLIDRVWFMFVFIVLTIILSALINFFIGKLIQKWRRIMFVQTK